MYVHTLYPLVLEVLYAHISFTCSLESSVLSVKSSLQEAKDQLLEKEMAYSLLQEQHAQVHKCHIAHNMYVSMSVLAGTRSSV